MKKLLLNEQKILELYSNGMTAEQIGISFGCSKVPILRVLNSNGITKQSIKQHNLEKAEKIKKEKQEKREAEKNRINPAELIAYYKEHTLKETAAYFKIGQARVRRTCAENGYEKPVFTWADWSEETKLKAKIHRAHAIEDTYGVANALCLGAPKIAERKSYTNLRWKESLEKEGLSVEMEFPIRGKQYDLHIKDTNILIEINPTITHNSTKSYSEIAKLEGRKTFPTPKSYHYDKWRLARDNGYEVISVFDWVNEERLLALILSKAKISKYKIGARQTQVKIIAKKEANEFLEKNHVLGSVRGSKINIGLFFKEALVSVMSFGFPRKKQDCQYELLRFANLEGYSIAGAASKLFSFFIENYNPESILTFSDNNLGNGSIYNFLGFTEDSLIKGQSIWINLKSKDTVRASSIVWQGADRLLQNKVQNYFKVGLDREDFIRRGGKEEYKNEYLEHHNEKDWWPGNFDILKHYNYLEVIDCGATRWIWRSV